MTIYEWCKYAYEHRWATVDQLKVWVSAGKITVAEFEQITGQVYSA